MKKRIWVMAAAMLLLGLLLWQGLHREAQQPSGGSGAAMGLMLLEREPSRGLYVLAVTQDSPAARAGIRPGDYLLMAGDTVLENAAQLDALIGDMAELSITLGRDGQQLQLTLPTR